MQYSSRGQGCAPVAELHEHPGLRQRLQPVRDELLLIQRSVCIYPHRHSPAAMALRNVTRRKHVHTLLTQPATRPYFRTVDIKDAGRYPNLGSNCSPPLVSAELEVSTCGLLASAADEEPGPSCCAAALAAAIARRMPPEASPELRLVAVLRLHVVDVELRCRESPSGLAIVMIL